MTAARTATRLWLRSAGTGKTPGGVNWLTKNTALFVGIQGAYLAVLAAALRAPLELVVTFFIAAPLVTLPLLPVYLGAVYLVPRRWRRWQRRVAAVSLSPILVGLLVPFALTGGFAVAVLVAALPGALVYGAAVRLPSTPDPVT